MLKVLQNPRYDIAKTVRVGRTQQKVSCANSQRETESESDKLGAHSARRIREHQTDNPSTLQGCGICHSIHQPMAVLVLGQSM